MIIFRVLLIRQQQSQAVFGGCLNLNVGLIFSLSLSIQSRIENIHVFIYTVKQLSFLALYEL